MNTEYKLFAERLYKACEEALQLIHAENELPQVAANIEVLYRSLTQNRAISLPLLDTGAYKEAYDLSNSLIIKFCACDNPTEKEIEFLETMQDSSFRNLFLPSWYFHLPEPLEAVYIEDCFIEDYCLTDCIIQPRVITAAYIEEEEENAWYDYIPNYKEDWSDFEDIIIRHYCNKEWLFAVSAAYGLDYAKEMLSFIKSNCIHDLHCGKARSIARSSLIGFPKRGAHPTPFSLLLLQQTFCKNLKIVI